MELSLKQRFNYLPVGFAVFSMFFGAGNSIFPLLIGSISGDKNLYAVLGLTISTIIVPILGLVAMALYEGNYKEFFYRLGKAPGFVIITMIMILIGPFAGIPRCITLAYSTLQPHLGATPLILFSGIACSIIFLTTIRRRRLVDILGKILTPLLLFCLAIIIVKGIYAPLNIAPPTGSITRSGIFYQGLIEGFQMMDLLASFFFSATVIGCLKAQRKEKPSPESTTTTFLKAVTLAGILLAIIYVGFSYVAANNSVYFQTVPQEALLGAVGKLILGQHMGFVMSLAVALACLTTGITLVAVFSDFIHHDCLKEKISRPVCIIGSILAAFYFSNLGFIGICNMIAPILLVCYPALITLTILNIAHKMFKFEPVKWPVYAVLAISFAANLTL